MSQGRTRAGAIPLIALALVGLLTLPATVTAVEIGDEAPEFTLPSTTGERVSLSQFRGHKLVLLEFHINDFGAT